jgi:hypothetical protein
MDIDNSVKVQKKFLFGLLPSGDESSSDDSGMYL